MGMAIPQLYDEYAYHSFKGMPCNSGSDYVYIDAKGLVYRCASGDKLRDPLGHVKTLGAPGTGPKLCGYGICPCREAQRLGLLASGPVQHTESTAFPG
jgi:hypothetical protein